MKSYLLILALVATQVFADEPPNPAPQPEPGVGGGLGDILEKILGTNTEGQKVTTKFELTTPIAETCEAQAKLKASEAALAQCATQFGSGCKAIENSAAVTRSVTGIALLSVPVYGYARYSSSSSDLAYCNSFSFPQAESNAKALCTQKYNVECVVVAGSTRATSGIIQGSKIFDHVPYDCKAESQAKPLVDASAKFVCEAQASAEKPKSGFSLPFGIKLPWGRR